MGLVDYLWHRVSQKAWFNWFCLFCIINPYFLCYYGYDSIGSIMDQTEKLFKTDKTGIGLLYSMHSIPVIATVFFIGIVIDKFGTRKTAVVLSVCALIGSMCVAVGTSHYAVLIIGRLLFGFGSESMSVCAQKMLSHKYKDSFLSLAFGFQIFWGQLGSCLVFILMPIFDKKFGTKGALWTVPVYAVFSLATTVLYCYIDWRYEHDSKHSKSHHSSTSSIEEGMSSLETIDTSTYTTTSSSRPHSDKRSSKGRRHSSSKSTRRRSSSDSESHHGHSSSSSTDEESDHPSKQLIKKRRADLMRPASSQKRSKSINRLGGGDVSGENGAIGLEELDSTRVSASSTPTSEQSANSTSSNSISSSASSSAQLYHPIAHRRNHHHQYHETVVDVMGLDHQEESEEEEDVEDFEFGHEAVGDDEHGYHQSHSSVRRHRRSRRSRSHSHHHGERFQLKDLKTLPSTFWILLVLYFLVSTTFFVWNTYGGDRLKEKYGYAPEKAGLVVALSNMAAMAAPITGFLVDRIGHRTKVIFLGVGLMLLTYCAITWTTLVPTMWYVFLGLGISLCQPIVFASVSLVVKSTIIGTAFSLMSLAMNVGQVALPPIVGKMRSSSGSYQSSNYVFVAMALLAVLFSIILYIQEQTINILDKIGLSRGTAPPSVYDDLYDGGGSGGSIGDGGGGSEGDGSDGGGNHRLHHHGRTQHVHQQQLQNLSISRRRGDHHPGHHRHRHRGTSGEQQQQQQQQQHGDDGRSSDDENEGGDEGRRDGRDTTNVHHSHSRRHHHHRHHAAGKDSLSPANDRETEDDSGDEHKVSISSSDSSDLSSSSASSSRSSSITSRTPIAKRRHRSGSEGEISKRKSKKDKKKEEEVRKDAEEEKSAKKEKRRKKSFLEHLSQSLFSSSPSSHDDENAKAPGDSGDSPSSSSQSSADSSTRMLRSHQHHHNRHSKKTKTKRRRRASSSKSSSSSSSSSEDEGYSAEEDEEGAEHHKKEKKHRKHGHHQHHDHLEEDANLHHAADTGEHAPPRSHRHHHHRNHQHQGPSGQVEEGEVGAAEVQEATPPSSSPSSIHEISPVPASFASDTASSPVITTPTLYSILKAVDAALSAEQSDMPKSSPSPLPSSEVFPPESSQDSDSEAE